MLKKRTLGRYPMSILSGVRLHSFGISLVRVQPHSGGQTMPTKWENITLHSFASWLDSNVSPNSSSWQTTPYLTEAVCPKRRWSANLGIG